MEIKNSILKTREIHEFDFCKLKEALNIESGLDSVENSWSHEKFMKLCVWVKFEAVVDVIWK